MQLTSINNTKVDSLDLASPLSLCVVRNELISIGQIAKQINCERAVAEWYKQEGTKNKP